MIDSLNLSLCDVTIEAALDLPGARDLRFDLYLLFRLCGDTDLRQAQEPKKPNQAGLKDDKIDSCWQRGSKVQANEKHAQPKNQAVNRLNASGLQSFVHLDSPRGWRPLQRDFAA